MGVDIPSSANWSISNRIQSDVESSMLTACRVTS